MSWNGFDSKTSAPRTHHLSDRLERLYSSSVGMAVRLFGLLLSLLALAVSGSDRSCLERCHLRFCDYSTSFRLGTEANVSFSSAMCTQKGARVGRITNVTEGHMIDRVRDINMSQWHPFGLNGTFPALFFKPILTPQRPGGPPVSTMAHSGIRLGNLEVLHNRCFVVPFASYQVLSASGKVSKIVKGAKGSTKPCIAFHTFVFSEGSVF